MSQAHPTKAKKKEIIEKVSSNCCIIAGCSNAIAKRGLCNKHANQFYSALRVLPDEEKAAKEQELIEKGLVLSSMAIFNLRPAPDNPFREMAAG